MLEQDDLYPTRGDQELLYERKDPILYGLDYLHKRLSEAEVCSYERNGFVIVPDVLDRAEVACLEHDLSSLKRRNKQQKNRFWRKNVPPGEAGSLFAPEQSSILFDKLSRDRRILDRVQHIVGSPVYLHRSRIHIEDRMNGSSYPWHSEFESWHAEDGVPRMRGVEAWVMLSESTPATGAFRMLAKSHYIYAACEERGTGKTNGNGHSAPPGFSRPSLDTLTRLLYFGGLVEAYGAPGTLVLCDSNLMYGSSRNRGPAPRVSAMFSYNSTENLPAARPFAGTLPRPAPLVNHDFTALVPESFNLAQAGTSDGARRNVRRRTERSGSALVA